MEALTEEEWRGGREGGQKEGDRRLEIQLKVHEREREKERFALSKLGCTGERDQQAWTSIILRLVHKTLDAALT